MLKTNGLRLEEREGIYCFADPETGKKIASLGEIVVYDSKEEKEIDKITGRAYNHRYKVEALSENEEYAVTLIVDKEYLNAEDTVYPVIVDPTITVNAVDGSTVNIEDVSIYTNHSVNEGAQSTIDVGNTSALGMSWGTARTLVRFSGLILRNTTFHSLGDSQITSVEYKTHLFYTSGNMSIDSYRMSNVWYEGSAVYSSALWSGYAGTYTDREAITPSGAWYSFDITGAAKDWKKILNGDLYGGVYDHRGIMLKENGSTGRALVFDSKECSISSFRPSVVVTYTGTPVAVTQVNLSVTSETLNVGQTRILGATVLPSNATNKTVFWTTLMGSAYASVDSNGKVTAHAPGTAIIGAYSMYNITKYATYMVTVKIPVASVSLSSTFASVKQGTTFQLAEIIMPANATNQEVTWSSFIPSVATVDSNGLVTAVADKGTTIIQVRTVDGNKTANCLVTVYKYVATVNNHYDLGYSVRYQETGSQSAAITNEYQDEVNAKFYNVFGLKITRNNAVYFNSLVDQCKNNIVNLSNIDTLCTDPTHSPVCTNRNSLTSHFWVNTIGGNTITNVLWSGHRLDYNRSSSGGSTVLMTGNHDRTTDRPKAVLFHELMHQYGAPDTYHMADPGVPCDHPSCAQCTGEATYKIECIMTKTWDYSLDEFPVCNGCKNDVINHLNGHH